MTAVMERLQIVSRAHDMNIELVGRVVCKDVF